LLYYLILMAWFAMPVALSLLTGVTLRGVTTYSRKTNPEAYWRGVRFWGLGFLLMLVFFSVFEFGRRS